MDDFRLLGLPEALLKSLELMSFHKPTPIQAQTIPSALEGHDILGSAQTGTGKTAAYGIPLASYLLGNGTGSALVLTPTRELALQVFETLQQILGRKSGIAVTLLIGGDAMQKQLRQLKSRPRLIVGTPGRVNDHLSRGTLHLDDAHFLVLDETDRMLDMGFTVQLQKIIKFLPEKRQTLMFSATMSPYIVNMAESYLNKPVRISVGSATSPVEKIKQEVVRTSEPEKYGELLNQLEQQQTGSCIIFVKTKIGSEKLAKRLRLNGHSADAIHGDLRQNKRLQVIKSFRNGESRLLVATDVAARGLDIPHIECVVNYDLPQCPEDYIHRIGRTGRAGAEGKAVSLITNQDNLRWRNINSLMNSTGKETDGGAPTQFARKKPDFARRDRGNGGREGGFGGRSGGRFGDRSESRPRQDSFSGPREPRAPREHSEQKEYSAPREHTSSRDGNSFGDRPQKRFSTFKSDSSDSSEFRPQRRPYRESAAGGEGYQKKSSGGDYAAGSAEPSFRPRRPYTPGTGSTTGSSEFGGERRSYKRDSFGEEKKYHNKPSGDFASGDRPFRAKRPYSSEAGVSGQSDSRDSRFPRRDGDNKFSAPRRPYAGSDDSRGPRPAGRFGDRPDRFKSDGFKGRSSDSSPRPFDVQSKPGDRPAYRGRDDRGSSRPSTGSGFRSGGTGGSGFRADSRPMGQRRAAPARRSPSSRPFDGISTSGEWSKDE